jgi:hypothetical protein
MLPFMDARFPPLRQWLWAILWSSFFTAIFLVILRSQTCFFLIEDSMVRLAVCILMWLWLYFFFLLSNRTRLILLFFSAMFFILLHPVERIRLALLGPKSQVQADMIAVEELRSLQAALAAAHQKSPQQGYPAVLPQQPSYKITNVYKVEYQTAGAVSAGYAEKFTLQLTPRRCDCGLFRSFLVTEDGKIHHTLFSATPAPATLADPVSEEK